MRFIRIAIQITSAIFVNCSSQIRQNLQLPQLIWCSKNSIISQSKWHDIHSVSVYWMKHMILQLSECSCAVWYYSQSDIIHDLILLTDLILSAVWYCWQIWYDLQFDIIHSLILCVIWYYLHSFILFFLFNFNCTFTSFYILRLEHALLILYFLHYIVIKSDDIFQKKRHLLWIWCYHSI